MDIIQRYLSDGSFQSSWAYSAFGALLLTGLGFIEAYRTDFASVPTLPVLPGAYPFLGHLPWLGGRLKQNDATLFTKWGQNIGSDFYQITLGYQRCLIVNSWEKMREFWITRNTSMLDRPKHAEFLDFVGIDISGSSWSDQLKRCRSAGVKALGKPMWPSYYLLMESNATKLINDFLQDGKNGDTPLDTFPPLRQMITDLTLYITYGSRVGDFDDELTATLLKSIGDVSSVRGSTATYRQYVPLLRLRPLKISKVRDAVKVRQGCIDKLYGQYLDKVDQGNKPQCIVSSLGADKLTLEEIHGTCVSLLQAAPNTVASGISQCCAWLCAEENHSFQEEAYKAVLDAYDGDRALAWEMAFREEKVPLLVSLYKEVLRFYAMAPYAARRVSRDIEIGGVKFPQGLQIMLNVQAVNHDPEHYGPTATSFDPKRFMGDTSPLPHLSYGTGARICPAYQISNRIIYGVLVRFLLAFEMKQVEGGRPPALDMVGFSDGFGLFCKPKTFDCAFIARDQEWLQSVMKQ